MILTSNQIHAWDAFTIKNEPIESIDLMERAALACFKWLEKMNYSSSWFHIFCGKGNNGGDGLALGRMLLRAGARVNLYILKGENKGTEDFQINLLRWKEYSKREINWLSEPSDFPDLSKGGIIIDALFGSGLNRPLDGFNAQLIKYLNEKAHLTISIDLPSGLRADELQTGDDIIRAHDTLSFQSPKLAFYYPENEKYTGEIHILDIGLHRGYLENLTVNHYLLKVSKVKSLYKPRQRFSHKGTFGHALIIAGSYGKIGAVLLSARACLHSGAGLLTIAAPKCAYLVLQTGVPEAMVISDEKLNKIVDLKLDFSHYQAIGIGPGMGTAEATRKWLLNQLSKIKRPMVLDADALNAIAYEGKWKCIPQNSVITPHPKEFDRLFGNCENSQERVQKAIEKAKELSCTVILKGHHTLIATPEGKAWFNTTGNSGMATGGSGDVLTGVITGLLAQGYSPTDASLLGVWLHGRAGDLAANEYGAEALSASHIIQFLGKAFLSITSS
jgi:NAD(P)H-hydrate epimerase